MIHYYPIGKRLLDLLLCGLVLPLALPLMGMVAGISALLFRHPVLYSHLRPGYRGIPFRFYKFSTLLPEEEREGRWLSEGERQTRWGKFLRDYSLDELPQLLNILKGDMSWVGPRPLLMEYLPLYTPAEKRRHWVKPGLTGLAQVMGRNELLWEEKMRYDQAYVARLSLRLDCAILAKTVATVLVGQRINFGIRPEQLLTASGSSHSPKKPSLSAENAF
ncbi:sugar transferase [Cesiribacter andamanensis]|uniref:Putative colanic biosynthesis UDP-glucose lipid carrier transferase n=1 Tax=Cesiribacter andamanensis AMV16 TaxID=1279009 RepID=M7NQZ3_9BACT|nr:sugar transferase [Cesiribacter andamanensis]EMR04135.1 Putative colanic biosynthesis UDP-glucose lipid carrier transferase [Cesiribacter andamanensis AMV16]